MYVSDAINITPNLLLLACVRADYFDSPGEKSDSEDNFDQFAFSPKFGLVYQPIIDKVSVFANYQNSFNNVAPTQVADADGSNPRMKSFEPEQANQWEVGVKTNILRDRVVATLSYYDINISNRVVGDASDFYNSIQGGELNSKGFEVDVTAKPVAGMTLSGWI